MKDVLSEVKASMSAIEAGTGEGGTGMDEAEKDLGKFLRPCQPEKKAGRIKRNSRGKRQILEGCRLR